MLRGGAVERAISLVRTPTLARSFRARPLPRDVIVLIRIAAGGSATTKEAIAASGESMHLLKEAAVFYLTQILLYQGADSYRSLGVSPDAPQEELRRNMAWLLRWLHPDLDQENPFHQYSRRVIRAWENLKTPERRAIYDKKLLLAATGAPASSPAVKSTAPASKSSRNLRFEKNRNRRWHHDIRPAVVVIVILMASAAWLSIAGFDLLFSTPSRPVTAAYGGWLDRVFDR